MSQTIHTHCVQFLFEGSNILLYNKMSLFENPEILAFEESEPFFARSKTLVLKSRIDANLWGHMFTLINLYTLYTFHYAQYIPLL